MKLLQSIFSFTKVTQCLAFSALVCSAGTGLFGQIPTAVPGEMLQQHRQMITNDPVGRPEYPVIPFILAVKDRALIAGDTMRIEFVVSNFVNIAAYQFALKLDTSHLKFQNVEVEPGVYLQLSDFGLFQKDKGYITCLFSDIQGLFLPDRTVLFHMTLVVKKSGQRLSDYMVLDDSNLIPRAYDDYLIPRLVILRYTTELSERQQTTDTELLNLRVWPNPYAGQASVSFQAHKPGLAMLQVYDAGGALCGQIIQQVSTAGPQVWTLPEGMPSGALYLEFTANGSRISKKIMHICP
jgi:hypothetical protein